MRTRARRQRYGRMQQRANDVVASLVPQIWRSAKTENPLKIRLARS
jgi:hypothetical protein